MAGLSFLLSYRFTIINNKFICFQNVLKMFALLILLEKLLHFWLVAFVVKRTLMLGEEKSYKFSFHWELLSLLATKWVFPSGLHSMGLRGGFGGLGAGGLLQQIWNPLSVLLPRPSPSLKSGWPHWNPSNTVDWGWANVVEKDFYSLHSKPKFWRSPNCVRKLKLQISTLSLLRRSHLANVDALVSNINKLDRQCPVLHRFKGYFHHYKAFE